MRGTGSSTVFDGKGGHEKMSCGHSLDLSLEILKDAASRRACRAEAVAGISAYSLSKEFAGMWILSGDPCRFMFVFMTASKKSAVATSAQEVDVPKWESGGVSCQPKCPPHRVSTTITFGFAIQNPSLFLLGAATKKSSSAVILKYGTLINRMSLNELLSNQ